MQPTTRRRFIQQTSLFSAGLIFAPDGILKLNKKINILEIFEIFKNLIEIKLVKYIQVIYIDNNIKYQNILKNYLKN